MKYQTLLIMIISITVIAMEKKYQRNLFTDNSVNFGKMPEKPFSKSPVERLKNSNDIDPKQINTNFDNYKTSSITKKNRMGQSPLTQRSH